MFRFSPSESWGAWMSPHAAGSASIAIGVNLRGTPRFRAHNSILWLISGNWNSWKTPMAIYAELLQRERTVWRLGCVRPQKIRISLCAQRFPSKIQNYRKHANFKCRSVWQKDYWQKQGAVDVWMKFYERGQTRPEVRLKRERIIQSLPLNVSFFTQKFKFSSKRSSSPR